MHTLIHIHQKYIGKQVYIVQVLDLGLTPCMKMKVQKLNGSGKEKRLERCKKLLRYMTHERGNKTFFNDEKRFSVALTHNNRVYAVNRNDLSNRLKSSLLKFWSQ